MATRLMLSLRKAVSKSGSFTRTEDLNAVIIGAPFASRHATMEEVRTTGWDRDRAGPWQDGIALQPVENQIP